MVKAILLAFISFQVFATTTSDINRRGALQCGLYDLIQHANKPFMLAYRRVLKMREKVPGRFEYEPKATKDGFFYFESFKRKRKVDDKVIQIGEIYFKYYPSKRRLFIDYIGVDKEYKGQRIGSLLMAQAVAKYADVKYISTSLGLDNFAAFEKGMIIHNNDIEKAIKETPDFKMKEKLGFTEVDMDTIDLDYDIKSLSFDLYSKED